MPFAPEWNQPSPQLETLLASCVGLATSRWAIFEATDLDDPAAMKIVFISHTHNPAGQDVTGLLGQPVGEKIPQLIEAGLAGQYLDILREQKPRFISRHGYKRDPTAERFYDVMAHPLSDTLLFAEFVDVTDLTQAEQLKDRALDELRRQKSHLQVANAELENFIKVASHDLRAPLRDIANLAEWLLEDAADLPTDSRSDLEIMRARSVKARKLVDDLLTYARAATFELGTSPMPLATLIEEALEQAEAPLAFRIEVDLGGAQDVEVSAGTALRQIVNNLVRNAFLHHDKAGSGHAWITAEVADDHHVTVTVADDGPGLSDDEIAALFVPTGSNKGVGVGLGLSICRSVALRAGAQLSCARRSPRGLAISLRWPAAAIHRDVGTPPDHPTGAH